MQTEKLKYIWEVSAGQRRRILLNCLTGVAGVAFALAFIYASKQVIDIATGVVPGSLIHAAIFIIVLLMGQLLCSAADTWISTRMQTETGNALRHRLFSRLLQSRWNELERFHTGDIVNRVEQDTSAIVTLLTSSIPAFIVTGVQLVAAFLFFCFLDSSLPWLIAAILPVFLLGSRFYMHRMRRYTHDIRHSDSRIQSVIQESLQHRTVIKTLEQSDRHLGKLDDLQDMLRNQIMGRTRFSLSARMLVAFAFSGGYLTAFLWGAVRLSTGSITFGTMTAFLQLVGKVQRPVLDLSRLIPSVINALTAIDRLLELEKLPAEANGDSIFFASTPALELRNVTFGYTPGDRPVFSSFSCSFPAGSCTAVVGETGRGKTTLIRLLLALATPQEGKILLTSAQPAPENAKPAHENDKATLELPKPQLENTKGDLEAAKGDLYNHPVSPQTRRNFVYVPQGNTLFSGTIRDNLLMGNPQASEAAMHRALRTATADFVFHLPDGIDSPLNEQGGGLSEGQAQRIAIARALLRPGHILLLDEATSALDPDTEQTLIKNLRRDCTGKTFIFVTHHPAVAEACEAVIRL
ncbi:ABC transporter ATP-binding protein [Bacteroides helcogenes]|uniref:ABC transporter related protein n=1 Tax=Bacteroides helcogenes (strain ATCC 35417 / DSM 20613 / JCM 6297 / CCUG 15421 / P 36-108) TaxID=693979 RepID=E6SSN2_BACT6|nr:ABC transporter ATP-binding protein [Bacteroides helcogenes]ADV43145.1 ABC transporter related protein [Bacteroides helcogenes P 36-108]MDY5239123.1 ABC transporter ATP-binding protein [Bacteroides helcogenes]